jgi:hypothetical protein
MRISPAKPLFLIFFTAIAAAIPSGAATVSIMIIETGAVDEAAGRTKTVDIWESGMMDVLFDNGHIVCNTPAIRIPNPGDEELPKEARRNFQDADTNGVDYFIITQLNYPQNEDPAASGPDNVSLRLYRIDPYGVLYNTSYALASGLSEAEEFSNAKKAAQLLSPYIRGGL